MYQKPKIICLNVTELEKHIVAAACSVYACWDENLYECANALFSLECYHSFYDIDKCDPFAAPSATHGTRNLF